MREVISDDTRIGSAPSSLHGAARDSAPASRWGQLANKAVKLGESLESVYQFDYLGCRFTSDGDDAADMCHRWQPIYGHAPPSKRTSRASRGPPRMNTRWPIPLLSTGKPLGGATPTHYLHLAPPCSPCSFTLLLHLRLAPSSSSC